MALPSGRLPFRSSCLSPTRGGAEFSSPSAFAFCASAITAASVNSNLVLPGELGCSDFVYVKECVEVRRKQMSDHDNDAHSEQDIRNRAYAIWEDQGRPDDRHLEHWQQAVREIEQSREARTTVGNSPGGAIPA